MKIKIHNWNDFETHNAIYFTRDINIKNELNVSAYYTENEKKYFLVYMDFIEYKILLWIEDGEYLEITDQNFSNEYVKVSKYISKYQDVDGLLELNMKNVVAKQWMLNNNEFFAMVLSERNLAEKLFVKNELK